MIHARCDQVGGFEHVIQCRMHFFIVTLGYPKRQITHATLSNVLESSTNLIITCIDYDECDILSMKIYRHRNVL